jgi:hypothetical protein
MLKGKEIAIVRKNYHRHLDGSLTDALTSIFYLQGIPSTAA